MKYSAIIADLGASTCRLMLAKERPNERSLHGKYQEYETSGFSCVEDVIDRYLRDIGAAEPPAMLALAVDCPVTGDVVTLISSGWTFSKRELAAKYGFEEVLAVNECTATAASIEWLEPQDFRPIGKLARDMRSPARTGRFVVVAPGANLGVAGTDIREGGISLISSEGGHALFAPASDLEIDILKRMRTRTQRVSQDSVLSERGLVSLYSAIAEIEGETPSDFTPLEVMLYASTQADPLCTKALAAFYECLGSFAGDVALSLLAVDGVFLTGDLVAANQVFSSRPFRERFEAKGLRSDLMRNIPTFAISHRGAVLLGMSRIVSDEIAHSVTERIDRALTTESVFSIVGDMGQALCVMDSDLNIVATTGRMFKIAGVPDELYRPGMPMEGCLRHMGASGWFDAEDVDAAVKTMLKGMRAGKDYVYERSVVGGRVVRDIGRTRPEGGFVIASIDVTEDVHRARELEKVAAQLRKAKTRADESVRAKSEFLANMSHEIRTPMNGVLGMAEILSGTTLDANQQDMVDVILKSGNSLLAIINDILDLSKIEAGKLRLRNDQFDLRSTIEDVAMMFAGTLDEKGLEMLVRYNPALPQDVTGDQGRMRQIVTNLVGNAVKFTDEGHVLIDVDGERSGEGVNFTISVTDTGCGIPADKLEAIFGLFEQVDGSSTRKHEGTGLGLNIARRLTGLMNGEIDVTSEVGKGSTFSVKVHLPAADDARLDVPVHGAVDMSGLNVLIVDDILVNRNILEEQCRSWGLSPTTAPNGAAALTAFQKASQEGRRFDVAIFDFQMPDMDGCVLAERVRSTAEFAQTPLILLSSVSHMDMANERAIELFNDTLTKPARAHALRTSVEKVLVATGRVTPVLGEFGESAEARQQAAPVAPVAPAEPEPAAPPKQAPTPALEPAGDAGAEMESASDEELEFDEVEAGSLPDEQSAPIEAAPAEAASEPVQSPSKDVVADLTLQISKAAGALGEADDAPSNEDPEIEFEAVDESVEAEPIAAPAPAAPAPAAAKRSTPADETDLGERVRVLLAEDNPVNVKVTLAMLGSDRFDVTVAEDGVAAVEAYQVCRPDIILMDVSMPRLDGLGAAARIRTLQEKEGRMTPIIGVTAHVMPEDRQRCLDAGMDGHLGKPTSRDALVSAIEEYLDIYRNGVGEAAKSA